MGCFLHAPHRGPSRALLVPGPRQGWAFAAPCLGGSSGDRVPAVTDAAGMHREAPAPGGACVRESGTWWLVQRSRGETRP